ncbi:MAG TPA: crossover junction endodeoxyribonuclease RuvC [Bacteroidetes bacterium]|jgi:crossover junction endodeoxyribonuclease RuvC|nr:crossover junction endodeoxyribonuclease RuvC [Bacteroidota bacterium]
MRSVRRKNDGTSIILGVDPGTLITGYGIVMRSRNAIRLLGCGTVRNAATASMPLRLKKIYTELSSVIQKYHPDELAIESAFYGKNAQSALKLGHARGVAILAAVESEIPTTEYSPREVKKAVVGNGSASKEQVQYMIKSMLHLPSAKMLHDTSDAIAIAVCHLHRLVTPTSKHKDWKSFVTAHPERVRS